MTSQFQGPSRARLPRDCLALSLPALPDRSQMNHRRSVSNERRRTEGNGLVRVGHRPACPVMMCFVLVLFGFKGLPGGLSLIATGARLFDWGKQSDRSTSPPLRFPLIYS